jgi:hypothetical protein
MNALTGSWKTSLAGIVSGLAIFAAQAYQPGMTPKQWGIAILSGLGVALTGILAKDHTTPPVTKPS